MSDGSRVFSGVEALRFGWRSTMAHWKLLVGVNLVGALALGVGLLVTVPTSALAAAYVFRRLQAHAASGSHAGATPAPPLTHASHPAASS